ncbi:DUF456 family protein [bacterium]|nr:DUF456 family protein [bacterium]
MDIVLLILAAAFIVIGIGGCVLPVLPGPPVAYIGLLFMHFSSPERHLSIGSLLTYAFFAILITVLDYLVPAWGTKKFGGTKWGTRGSTIGLLVAVFLLPVMGITLPVFGLTGIIFGPFIGAFIGEKMGGMHTQNALRAGVGSFIGFLAGTFMKLVYCFWILYVYIGKLGWFS